MKWSKRGKKIIKWVVLAGGILIAAYVGIGIYFLFHFLPGTVVGGKDFSMKGQEELEEYLSGKAEDYQLTVTGPGNWSDEVISGNEIRLTLAGEEAAKELMQKQKAFLWPASLFGAGKAQAAMHVEYDRDILEQKIRSLPFFSEEEGEPVSAHPQFDGETFVIIPETYAMEVEKTQGKVRECIERLETELDLEEEGCLKVPEYLSDSEAVEKACEEMNRYCSARITYTMGERIVIDSQVISGWLSCDEAMKVTLNEGAVKEWVSRFASEHDSAGGKRSITTPWGKTAEVSGGTYGWVIDEKTEVQALLENIRNGDVLEREPSCQQRAAALLPQDWGTTYLEVDLTDQYMWYIKDGNVVLESDVVTGDPSPEMATPSGVYSILYTERDAVLVGEPDPVSGEPIYRQGVRYWMPFTQQGHGFHDADWQSSFGGNVYTYSGSHGCVNMPVDKAGQLFEMLDAGTPVVLHY